MATRRFSAANDEIRFPVAVNLTGAWSMAILNDLAGVDTVWQAMMNQHTSAGTGVVGIERRNTQRIGAICNGAAVDHAGTLGQAADGWAIWVVTKSAGTTAPRIHKWTNTGGTWTHNVASATGANSASQASGSMRFGEFGDVDDLDGWIAHAAVWGSELSDAQVEALATNKSYLDWTGHAVTPAEFYPFQQATATEDITGLIASTVASGAITSTTDTSGIAGTSVDTANDPAGWTLWSPAAASELPIVVMAPPVAA